MMSSWLTVVVTLLATVPLGPLSAWGSPTVAILSKPVVQDDQSQGSFFGAEYVKWLESAGLRVVPLLYDSSDADIDLLLSRVNGVLFTGGSVDLKRNDQYYHTAKRVFDTVVRAASSGDPLPIWGTCMGFQLLCILAAEDPSVLLDYAYDSQQLNIPLEMKPFAYSSRILGGAPNYLLQVLATRNVTINYHHDGVPSASFDKSAKLRGFFDIASINHDRKGLEFVSTIEARSAPIFAVQWHPERAVYVWDTWQSGDKPAHSQDAVDAASWVVRAFARAVRESKHSFPSQEAEDKALVWQNCPDVGTDTQTYHFTAQKQKATVVHA